jgi:hypothetical protein
VIIISREEEQKTRLGGWSISEEVVAKISDLIKPNDIILELGSGTGTGVLAETYQMISVENNPAFLGIEDTHYIHAPIIDYDESPYLDETGWYDHNILKAELPLEYDLLLVDGPHGRIGRSGFLSHLDLFRSDKPVIVDDSHRVAEATLAENISKAWNMKMEIFTCGEESNEGLICKYHLLTPR